VSAPTDTRTAPSETLEPVNRLNAHGNGRSSAAPAAPPEARYRGLS
jgi:hypothetical protein